MEVEVSKPTWSSMDTQMVLDRVDTYGLLLRYPSIAYHFSYPHHIGMKAADEFESHISVSVYPIGGT